MEILIKNGLIVNAQDSVHTDLRIIDQIIDEIGQNLEPRFDSATIIDATNRTLFPGGIDPHVHMHLPFGQGFSSDDFVTGSRAALFGGTTTLLDFVTPHKKQSLTEALQIRKGEATGCFTDFSFHVSPVDWHDGIANELEACKTTYGITSFKVYMAYKDSIGLDDNILLKVMQEIGRLGGMVMVHAEMGDEIEVLRNQLIASGKTSPEFHPLSRPAALETAAVERIIGLSKKTGCPVYIVHLSAKSSLEAAVEARKMGVKLFVETCPQYLLLNDDKYKGDFNQTAAYVMSPPLRTKNDNNALWQGLATGEIQTIGTDHCPFTLKQKSAGKHDFRLIPNGAGGVEHRMSLLFSEGVLKNRISLEQFVGLTSTHAARIFGLYPAKGLLAVGSDADVVIWNPTKKQTISTRSHHQNCDLNIYEGTETTGAPEIVIKSGKIVVKNDQFLQTVGQGKFLARF